VSAVQSKAQEVDRLRAFTTTLARVSIREATKFNELGLRQLQGETEPSQPLHKCFLSTKSIRTILETQHEVVDYRTMQASPRSRGLPQQLLRPLSGSLNA
jgi:hypothetical protein